MKTKKYLIGRIFVTPEGFYEVVWAGLHAEQGGPTFTTGSISSTDPKWVMSYVGENMEKCDEHYKTLITRKEGEV